MSLKICRYFLILLLLFSCRAESARPVFVVTGSPIDNIIQEIIGTRGKVAKILPPGASPHTYSPKPGDMAKAADAAALIYVSENLDGWAAGLNAKKKIKLIDLLPKEFRMVYAADGNAHGHEDGHKDEAGGAVDPHFWLDPMAVKAILPALADTLGKLSPENAEIFRSNAALFAKRLDVLNRQIEAKLAGVRGKNVFQFHPSFNYFLRRYGMNYGGVIELSPGKEPSPRFLANLGKKIKETQAKAIFSEPQLPEKPARAIADAAGVMLFIIDPVGGAEGRKNYSDLLLFNANVFRKALE